MTTWLVAGLSVALAACGSGGQGTAPAVTHPTAVPTTAFDAALAQLQAVRPFLKIEGDAVICDAYTAEGRAAFAQLAGKAAAAHAARATLAGPALSDWQKAHDAALTEWVAQVAPALRQDTACAALKDDAVWSGVARTLVTLGQPSEVPTPVVQRRAATVKLLEQTATVKTKADCEPFMAKMQADSKPIMAALAAMSPVLVFIDDQVWEEEDEKQILGDGRFEALLKMCAP